MFVSYETPPTDPRPLFIRWFAARF
jgi:hypothetical protein